MLRSNDVLAAAEMSMRASVRAGVAFDFISGIGAAAASAALSNASRTAASLPDDMPGACNCSVAAPGCSASRSSLPARSRRWKPDASGFTNPITTSVCLSFGSRETRIGDSSPAFVRVAQQALPQSGSGHGRRNPGLIAVALENQYRRVGFAQRRIRQRQRAGNDLDFELGG